MEVGARCGASDALAAIPFIGTIGTSHQTHRSLVGGDAQSRVQHCGSYSLLKCGRLDDGSADLGTKVLRGNSSLAQGKPVWPRAR
jgi:hypothetical protein